MKTCLILQKTGNLISQSDPFETKFWPLKITCIKFHKLIISVCTYCHIVCATTDWQWFRHWLFSVSSSCPFFMDSHAELNWTGLVAISHQPSLLDYQMSTIATNSWSSHSDGSKCYNTNTDIYHHKIDAYQKTCKNHTFLGTLYVLSLRLKLNMRLPANTFLHQKKGVTSRLKFC
jgi:hypothetical protein